MNIPDGEYDIDLSLFGHEGEADTKPSLAIRYGFIPDSMDQASSLMLFQKDELCILEAPSVQKSKQHSMPPIIFEGVPQRQRPVQSGASIQSSLPQDSYFFSISPAEKGKKNQLKVQLRRLDSTVRVNKSRNAEKWRTSIKGWRSGVDDSVTKTVKSSVDLPPIPQRSAKVQSPLIQRRPGRPTINKNSSITRALPPKKAASALKRPPIEKADAKDTIISVSDFEDLSSDSEDSFPVFESMASSEDAKNKKSEEVLPKQISTEDDGSGRSIDQNSAISKTEIAKNSERKPANNSANDLDMDDDFADLEDQLDEVLEDGQVVTAKPSKPTSVSDSDEDSDTGFFTGTPIKIDNGEEESSKKNVRLQSVPSKSKPMSLRDLYGGEKNDYLSSSEEE